MILYMNTLLESLKESSSQCTLISLPLYPVCKHNKTYEEKNEFYNAYKKSLDECSAMPSLCINLEYIEKEAFNWKFADKNVTFKFGYEFPSNSTTLYEEYWVYDGINAIGSVGGTLGMCVGFSFTGLISFLLNILQRAIFIINTKLPNRKLSKHKSHKNGLLINRQNKSKQNGIKFVVEYPRKYIYSEEDLEVKIEEKMKLFKNQFHQSLDEKLEGYSKKETGTEN